MNRNLIFALAASGFIAVASGTIFFLISGPAESISSGGGAAVGGAAGNYEITVASDERGSPSRALQAAEGEGNETTGMRKPSSAAPVVVDEPANAGVAVAERTPGDVAVSMREEPGSRAIPEPGFERASYIGAGRGNRDGGAVGRVVSRAESLPGSSRELASGKDVVQSESALVAGAESAALEKRQFAEKPIAKDSVAATSSESAQNEVAQPVRRRARAWPKPFTADEERFRQRVGVQSYINLQHEWATGQKRE